MVTTETSTAKTANHSLINELEARTFRAWSPLKQNRLSGWSLGCSDGYTRRANSVYPLDCLSEDVDAVQKQIEACETWYDRHQQPTCFKLTQASQPAALDSILAARGYQSAPGALVMVADLSQWQMSASDDELKPSQGSTAVVGIETHLTEHWLDCLCEMNAAQAPHKRVIRQMLADDDAERYFGIAFDSQDKHHQPAAVGLAVRDGDYVGLFDIVSHATLRRRGHGRRLVRQLLNVAVKGGARTAYLQVVEHNFPAISLYEGLGFRRLYEYWYRQKP